LIFIRVSDQSIGKLQWLLLSSGEEIMSVRRDAVVARSQFWTEPVEDIAEPVHAAESPAEVEMILLTAAEGG
jgi:hypothetical protein